MASSVLRATRQPNPDYCPMLINKIFHLRQPVFEARERLREFETWNWLEPDAEVKCIERNGIGRFEFGTGPGQRVSTEVEEVAGDDPNRILFRSVGGDVELAGMIELFPIRANLTEAVLTVDYEAESRLQKVIEAMATAMDDFVNRQLARIERCMALGSEPGVSGGYA